MTFLRGKSEEGPVVCANSQTQRQARRNGMCVRRWGPRTACANYKSHHVNPDMSHRLCPATLCQDYRTTPHHQHRKPLCRNFYITLQAGHAIICLTGCSPCAPAQLWRARRRRCARPAAAVHRTPPSGRRGAQTAAPWPHARCAPRHPAVPQRGQGVAPGQQR